MGQILSSTPRDQYTPKHEPQPTSSPNNGDFLREDMFGVLPEMMNGGTSAYQQFVSVFAPEARAIKNKLQLPISELEVSAAMWTALKTLNARRKVGQLEAAQAGTGDVVLGREASLREEELYHEAGAASAQCQPGDYVLVLASSAKWKHAQVIEVDDRGNVHVNLGEYRGMIGYWEVGHTLRRRKESKLGKRIKDLYEELKKAVDDFQAKDGKRVPGFKFYEDLEDRSRLRKEQEEALARHQDTSRYRHMLQATIVDGQEELRREKEQLIRCNTTAQDRYAQLNRLRVHLLPRFECDTPEDARKRAEYRALHAEKRAAEAQAIEHQERIKELNTMLSDMESELLKLDERGDEAQAPDLAAVLGRTMQIGTKRKTPGSSGKQDSSKKSRSA